MCDPVSHLVDIFALQHDVHRECQQFHLDWRSIRWRHDGKSKSQVKGVTTFTVLSCVCCEDQKNSELLLIILFQVTSDLFDIMSGQTDVDHPLCEECTDTLLDHLDTQLNITENECQNYK